jgi:hypothetical protein
VREEGRSGNIRVYLASASYVVFACGFRVIQKHMKMPLLPGFFVHYLVVPQIIEFSVRNVYEV